jgi:hypothetical protein
MASTLTLLRRLLNEKVDLVLVGGFAAIAHGSALVTEDVDVCIRFDAPTVAGIQRALMDLHPVERMSPARPPLSMEPGQYVGYRNLYVATDEGVIDFLGEITGLGTFERVAANALTLQLADFPVKVIGLADLITSKRALARPKDLRVARELELVLERLKKP